MSRKLTLSAILTVCAFIVGKISFATVYVDNGTNTNYNLTSADSLYIASGTYTGSITGFASGAKITISYTATFNPLAMPNNANGTIHNYGIFTYTAAWTVNTNFTVNNYAGGVMTFGAVTIKGKDQKWTNNIGGTLNFSGNVVMNGAAGEDNNVMINYETVNASGNFQMNSGSYFTNYKDFNVSGNYKANGGILDNQGNFVVTGSIDLNSGASSITNRCRMEASGGISVSNGFLYNYSYLWARNSDLTVSTGGVFQNINIGNASNPIVHGRNYTHTGGSMTGPGLLYFYGTTSITGGTVGVLGATTDTIKMNDITRTSPSTIFDIQAAGTVRPNVIYNTWGAPDSLRSYLFGCSVEIFMEIPLAINWNSFYVILNDNIPVLNWSTDYEPGTVFEIQRSYDGVSFQAIGNTPSEYSRSEYTYNDKLVGNRSSVVYYRIKATGSNGAEKYSQIRTVRFKNNQGVIIYTAPNPFTSNFNIDYTATENETITIRMFTISGQQKFTKNVMVNKGNNIVNITEAARLASGIYVMQVSNDHTILSTNKMIKR